jgi:hypothetical protein
MVKKQGETMRQQKKSCMTPVSEKAQIEITCF